MKRIPYMLACIVLMLAGVAFASPAQASDAGKEDICHPNNGNGYVHISVDKASSHFDEQGNPKHINEAGQPDVYSVNGLCPGETTPPAPTCESDPTLCQPPPPVVTTETRTVYTSPGCEQHLTTMLIQERTITDGVPGPWLVVQQIADQLNPAYPCPTTPPVKCHHKHYHHKHHAHHHHKHKHHKKHGHHIKNPPVCGCIR